MSYVRKLSPLAASVRHVLLMAGAAVMLIPFIWMVSLSLKPPQEIFTINPSLFPKVWYAWENYSLAFKAQPLLRYLLNGVIVTLTIFTLQMLVAVPCAYALAKLDFRGKGLLFSLVLFCLLIPPQVPAIPLYIAFWKLRILNSYAALILPFTISVFGIFLMRQFFKMVPDDLIDAARLDGMGEFTIVWRIVIPTAVPALVAFGIFSVIAHWNDFFWPLIAIQDHQFMTPPLGIMTFRNDEAGNEYGAIMAAAVVICLPLIMAFLLAQRRFIEGITFTGLKR